MFSVDISILYLVTVVFKLKIHHCKSSSDVARRTRSSTDSI